MSPRLKITKSEMLHSGHAQGTHVLRLILCRAEYLICQLSDNTVKSLTFGPAVMQASSGLGSDSAFVPGRSSSA